jgi:plasmid stabilization system protein ParE
MRVVFSKSAEADLEAIGDYIAKDNRTRAVSFVEEIQQRCVNLQQFPRSYPLVPRYEQYGFRRAVHGNYLIFYRIGPDAVEIVRILNGAMDYEAILSSESGQDR